MSGHIGFFKIQKAVTMNDMPSRTPRLWIGIITLLAVCPGLHSLDTTAQEPLRSTIDAVQKKHGSDVKDTAGLFELGAVDAARKELGRIEHETGVSTVIQTVESLRGKKIAEAAVQAARESGIQGIYVLIASSEREIELLVSKKYLATVTGPHQAAIRAGFIEGFKKRDFNEGLKHGVAAIAEQLQAFGREGSRPKTTGAAAAAFGLTSAAPTHESASPALVLRNQVRLNLAGARALIAAARARAEELKFNVNIAVVDDGGHLIAFERMDGARPASLYTAVTKATSAATFRQPTGPLPAGTAQPDPVFNLSLQNAAQVSGGKITALQGGLPIVVDGQIIGAVGVGGGTGEQDAQVARAAVQAFTDQLSSADAASKATKTPEKPE